MNSFRTSGRRVVLIALWGWLFAGAGPLWAQSSAGAQGTNEILILDLKGHAEISLPGPTRWLKTQTGQILRPYDRLRTGPNSRVTLRWSDQSTATFDERTELEILPPHAPQAESGLRLFQGIFSFFHRDQPGRIRILTRGTTAGIEGTEFVLAVDATNDTERVLLSLIDGQVRFSNEQGLLVLTNRQQALAESGKRPVFTAGFIANNILQWCFYYPAVLDLSDLPLAAEEQTLLADSLAAYRQGDLLAALAKYPDPRTPGSDAERIYYAGLLLSVGRVERTEAILAELHVAEPGTPLPRLAAALRQLIAAVKRDPDPSTLKPQLATELLAASYFEQSRAVGETSLKTALDLARQATVKSPEFGFAWARVAELEFSFGHTGSALDALNRGLALAPRNAQAIALKGFLLAAQNNTREAIEWFNQAIAVDSALGNAWLGRGLCRIRRGDAIGGREDLLVAAGLEPRRGALRSYLGKAYANQGDYRRAGKELERAKELDEHDPTAWLYSALLKQQQNRINEAIGDLERSEELNDNRSLYRSQLLLDQDRAVRSANLAAIYRDAGMFDVSLREASRAVSYDYANYSAHLFLANSYNELRDPNGINLRYETPAESEYLIANLLAPVGAGTLSPLVSQQEYSKLFEHDRLGIVSSTEYLSRGAWTQSGAQYGILGNTSYSMDAFYRFDRGQRPNNDFEDKDLSWQVKQQITAGDAVALQALFRQAEGGDLGQYYDQSSANRGLRTREEQEPILIAGYHHEWRPGVHTLLLAARLDDRLSVTNPSQVTLFVSKNAGVPDFVAPIFIHEQYQSALDINSVEAQQIWQQGRHTTIVGGRYQAGDFHTRNLQSDPSDFFLFFRPNRPAALQDFNSPFERIRFYGYHQWNILSPLTLIGGVAYDRLAFPENFRAAPISDREDHRQQVSPKAGLIWTPDDRTAVRAAYTRSLAGASFDQSFQLEPSQVAGFNQSFRSIIPESVGGAEVGARFETGGVSLEHQIGRTYLGIAGEVLRSKVNRKLGVFDLPDPLGFTVPSGTREDLGYREESLLLTLNQLLGDSWALGGRYRLSKAILEDGFVQMPNNALFSRGFRNFQDLESTLHQLSLYTIYNHPSGAFAQLEGIWYSQSNSGYAPNRPGDNFWQFNLQAGFRFPQRRAEVALGLLNLTGRDYQLNPLTLYNDLPRQRTLVVRLQISF